MKAITFYSIVLLILSGCAASTQFNRAQQAGDIESYEAYLARFPDKRFSDDARFELGKLYHDKDWSLAQSIHTIEGYESFLSQYPDGPFKDEAFNRIFKIKEERAWLDAKRLNTIFSLEAFLMEYPDSEFDEQAHEILYLLELERDWKLAVENGSIESYQQFLNQYPSSNYQKDALDKIAWLEKYHEDWQKAKAVDSIGVYMHFISNFEGTACADSAAFAIDKIEEIEWEFVYAKDTQEDYEAFIRNYPDSKFAKLAEMRIVDLEVDKVFKGKHGKMPSMQKLSSISDESNVSDVSVYNNTSFTLTLLYSGTESKRVEIAPKQRTKFAIINGKYRIAAWVSDPKVRRFAGTENIDGGRYDVEYYIYTTRY